MMSAELQKAIDALAIEDVYVRTLVARCEDGFDPKYQADIDALELQSMHQVRESAFVDAGGEQRILRVFIDMGVRWVDPAASGEEPAVRAIIEAGFVAEYRVTAELEQASVDEFARKNASYHVWPYWRELLTAQCARMHLPRLILPAVQLARNRHGEPAGQPS